MGPPVKYLTDHSRAVLLLWIICVIYVLCLSRFRVCSLLPGKGMTSWLLFVMFIVILLLSHLVSWDRCDTRFYYLLCNEIQENND